MPRPLFDHLSEIESLLRTQRRVLLFLDFDGTLCPIVENPHEAVMPAETRATLQRLSSRGQYSVAIVSGRALGDVRNRVGLPRLIYAGNHGLEICGEGMHFAEPEAVQRIKILAEISRRLGDCLRHIPGVEIENKVLTTSVHFRRADRESVNEIRQAVHAELACSERIFRVTRGLQVLEIRPRVRWDKGSAVRWIQEATGMADALSVYIGDDVTDEDAFSALPDGVTVRVGEVMRTDAQYYLDEQRAVAHFLTWLADESARRVSIDTAHGKLAGIRRT